MLLSVLTTKMREAPYPILPRVGFSSTKDPNTSHENSELTVVTTMFPLNKDIRMQATLLSGNFVSTSQALDLDALVSGQSSPKPRGCAEQLSATKNFSTDVPTAYLQVSRLSQISTAEHIRQFLKQNGYGAPSADLVESVPTHAEIRVCNPEQFSFAEKTAHLLAACGLGEFNAKVIDGCKADTPKGVQEVWLRKDNASAESIVASSVLTGGVFDIPGTAYISNDVTLSPEPTIRTRTVLELTQLRVHISDLVGSIKMPVDNCASFRPDNPVITINDASIVNDGAVSLKVDGVAMLWSCVANPVPHSSVQWREQKIAGPFGMVTKVPEIKTWAGTPIKTLISQQKFTMQIPFGARIGSNNAFEIFTEAPVITADEQIADAIRMALGEFASTFSARVNDAAQQSFQNVTSLMPRALLGKTTYDKATLKVENNSLYLETGGRAIVDDQILSWSSNGGFDAPMLNQP